MISVSQSSWLLLWWSQEAIKSQTWTTREWQLSIVLTITWRRVILVWSYRLINLWVSPDGLTWLPILWNLLNCSGACWLASCVWWCGVNELFIYLLMWFWSDSAIYHLSITSWPWLEVRGWRETTATLSSCLINNKKTTDQTRPCTVSPRPLVFDKRSSERSATTKARRGEERQGRTGVKKR